jgi:hypothetical protein
VPSGRRSLSFDALPGPVAREEIRSDGDAPEHAKRQAQERSLAFFRRTGLP